ncbi:hypothetical protein [Devosia geojensis]|uniref:hypothetical protein n=1 Tax=Devosia geojensis TaxID=443610 RepID=UPI00128CB838|nr:hypothetical protein [Devosia geojensis]
MRNRITIRIEDDVAEALERFISEGPSDFRTKQDAYRFVVREWLVTKGYLMLDFPRCHGRDGVSERNDRSQL